MAHEERRTGILMEIHCEQGIAPNKENWFVVNRIDVCPPRPWPGFEAIEPPPLLSAMARRLFSLCDSHEIVILAETLPYFAELSKKVEKVDFRSVHLSDGEQGGCHFDCCKNYKPDTDQYYAGFGLNLVVDRLTWQPHSWLMRGDTIIEHTPSIRHQYWGRALTPEEAAGHCKYLTS